MFGGIDGITAADYFVGRQTAAWRRIGDGGKGTPTAKVNVVTWGAIHINVNIAWVINLQVIPCRVWGRD